MTAEVAGEQAGSADKRVPDGRGYWIAFAPPLEETIRALRQLSATWVAPRVGGNGWNDPGANEERLRAYKDDGLSVYPWIYTTPSGARKTIDAFSAIASKGLCDGIIVDAEAEFCHYPEIARNFASDLRQSLPGVWIAHAPFDMVQWHLDFPYAEFGEVFDAVMPQLYAYEHDDAGYDHWIRLYESQWRIWEAAHPEATLPRMPIGCSYRPRTRAGKPIGTFDESVLARDIVAHQPYLTGGLYSLEMTMQDPTIFQALRDAARLA